MTCNGWTNAETWTVNLWFGDTFSSYADDGEPLDADACRELVKDAVYSLIAPEGVGGFITDMMQLNAVNWEELAEAHGG